MNGVNKQNASLDVLKKTLGGMKARLGGVNNEQLLSEIAQMESQIQSLQSAVDERAAQIKDKEDFDKNRENFNNELKGKYDQRKELSDKRSSLQFAYNLWTPGHDEKVENVRNTEEQIRAAQEKKAELENNEDLSFSERRKLVSEQNKKLKDLNAALKEQKEDLNSNDLYDKTGNLLNEISEQSRTLSKEINEMEAKAAKYDGMEQKIKDNEAEVNQSISALRNSMTDLQKSVADELQRIKDEKERERQAVGPEKYDFEQYKEHLIGGMMHVNFSEKELREMKGFEEGVQNSVKGIQDNLDKSLVSLANDLSQNGLNKIKSNTKNMNAMLSDIEKQFKSDLDKDKKQLEEKGKVYDNLLAKNEKEIANLQKKEEALRKDKIKFSHERDDLRDKIRENESKVVNRNGRFGLGLRMQRNRAEKMDREYAEKERQLEELQEQIAAKRKEIHDAYGDYRNLATKNAEKERVINQVLTPLKTKVNAINEAVAGKQADKNKNNVVQMSISEAMARKGSPQMEQPKTEKVVQKQTPTKQKAMAAG